MINLFALMLLDLNVSVNTPSGSQPSYTSITGGSLCQMSTLSLRNDHSPWPYFCNYHVNFRIGVKIIIRRCTECTYIIDHCLTFIQTAFFFFFFFINILNANGQLLALCRFSLLHQKLNNIHSDVTFEL